MTPKVHQVLHGYSDGHRMIAGSLSLSSAESRTMVVMSDLSGPGVRPGPEGYLTGYPLEGGGRYVLARTWSAPEMPRPGCVWTHSLVVENADLATLKSSGELLSAFRRPAGADFKADYTYPMSLPLGPSRPIKVAGHRVRSLVNALYGAPTEQVVASAEEPSDDEEMLLGIWLQQWPRLRRAFGFCTLAGVDRSGKGVRLDVQLVPELDRSGRSRFSGAILPQEVKPIQALGELVRDLEGVDDTRLREFLRRAGGDVDGGRRAMVPLCRLHSSLFNRGSPDLPEAVAALGTLDHLGKRQARSVRSMVVKRAIEEVDELDDEVFEFVIDAFEGGGPSDRQPGFGRLGASLWRRSPERFFAVLDAGGDVSNELGDVLRSLSPAELIRGLKVSPKLAARVVSARPDLLEDADFWLQTGAAVELIEELDDGRVLPVALALIKAGSQAAASYLVPRMEASMLATAIDEATDSPVLDAWLKELARYPDRTAAALASGGLSRRSGLVMLARQMNPDTVPNEYGDDPWLLAIRTASGRLEQHDGEFLASFLLSRALGFRSRSPAELIRQSYTTVYRALERSRLPRDVESLVTWRLNWGGWFGWDNCSRLRETVVELFVDRHLDPETFGRLTDDGGLATSLIDEAALSGRGRRYLAEVRKALKDAKEKPIRTRAEYIAKKVK